MKSPCPFSTPQQRPESKGQNIRRAKALMIPSALMVLMPKCPMCLAAYVTLFTGIELSAGGANHLHFALTAICVASICFLIFTYLRQIHLKINQHKKGE